MSPLTEKKCKVCEGGVLPLDRSTCEQLVKEVSGWNLATDGNSIVRRFSFKGFYATMSFVNAVAYLVQKEGHHPDMEIGFNYCNIRFTTHAISGLSENDFICAAKINALEN